MKEFTGLYGEDTKDIIEALSTGICGCVMEKDDGQVALIVDDEIEKEDEDEQKEKIFFKIAKRLKKIVKDEGLTWKRKNREICEKFATEVSMLYYIYDVLMGRTTSGKTYGKLYRGELTTKKERDRYKDDKENDENGNLAALDKDVKKYAIKENIAKINKILKENSTSIEQQSIKYIFASYDGESIRGIRVEVKAFKDGWEQDLKKIRYAMKKNFPNLDNEIFRGNNFWFMRSEYYGGIKVYPNAKNIEGFDEFKEWNKVACWDTYINDEARVKVRRLTRERLTKEYCKDNLKKALIIWEKLRELFKTKKASYDKGWYEIYNEPSKNIIIVVSSGLEQYQITSVLKMEIEIFLESKLKTIFNGLKGIKFKERRNNTLGDNEITLQFDKKKSTRELDEINDKIGKLCNKFVGEKFGKGCGIRIIMKNYYDEEYYVERGYCFKFEINIER